MANRCQHLYWLLGVCELDIQGLAGNTQRPVSSTCYGGRGKRVCHSFAISGLSRNMFQEHFALFTNLFVGGIKGKGTEAGWLLERKGPAG